MARDLLGLEQQGGGNGKLWDPIERSQLTNLWKPIYKTYQDVFDEISCDFHGLLLNSDGNCGCGFIFFLTDHRVIYGDFMGFQGFGGPSCFT